MTRQELARFSGESVRALYPGATLWGSGRAALLAALESGRARGWRRVVLPSYFCGEVREALAAAGWPVAFYEDHPFLRPAGLPHSRLEPGEVLVRVDFFGWRGEEEAARSLDLGCDVIEDHTHDPAGPWARASRAHLAFASLRKTIPAPSGAVLWSPRGEPVPCPKKTTGEHATAAELKRLGMVGKRTFLSGGTPASDHRRSFKAGEARLGRGEPSGPDAESAELADALSPVALGEARRRAHERILAAPGFPRAWLPEVEPSPGARPFVLVLDLGSRARRDRVAAWLIRRRVFPTILWPLGREASESSRNVSARTLTLPCDLRSTDEDLDAIGRLLAEASLEERARGEGWLAGPRALLDRLRG